MDPEIATESVVTRPAEGLIGGDWQKLDPRYVDLQRQVGWITAAVLTVMAAVGFVILLLATSLPLVTHVWIGGLLAVILALLTWWLVRWPAVEYRFASYRIDANGLEIREGVYFRSVTNVPRSRVQHTDVSQGPLQRQHDLATLVVHTAGRESAEVHLAGLTHHVALQIRDHLLPRNTEDAV